MGTQKKSLQAIHFGIFLMAIPHAGKTPESGALVDHDYLFSSAT